MHSHSITFSGFSKEWLDANMEEFMTKGLPWKIMEFGADEDRKVN